MSDELAIETISISKIYGSGNTEVVAMRDASVQVRRGEVIALLVHNLPGRYRKLS